MSTRRSATSILARWLGWTLFWYGVYYAGVEVQTWVFSKDAGPKPAAADILGPLHFWAPAVFFFLPVSHVAMPSAVWSLIVAGLIVWVEDQLRASRTPRIGTWILVGVIAVLLVLRLVALLAHGESVELTVGIGSYLLLGGLVLGTWGFLIIGLVAIGARRLRRRDPARSYP